MSLPLGRLLPASLRPLITAAAVFAALPLCVALSAPAAALTDPERKEIQTLIRETLRANPEIVLEAIQALRSREEANDERGRQTVLKEKRSQIFTDPAAPVIGNPKGDVTLVEFFDYNCGYCKAVFNDIQTLIKADGNLRVVFKELPILSPSSSMAAQAALAAHRQNKYLELHLALMGHRGALGEDTVYRLAGLVGLDVDKLKADMATPAIKDAIEANSKLAEALSIRGTPAFVIGDTVVPGAVDLDALKKLIAQARKKS
ncbi:DsbA family protein [uncultured Gammaproteobacteria bacterium]